MQRSAGDVGGRSLFWTGVAVFLLAVVVGRIIFQGGDARVALLLAVPLLLVVLGLRFGWVLGALLSLFFVSAVFAVRAALHASLLGVAPLLMLPFLGLATYLAWNVVRKMRTPRTVGAEDGGPGTVREGPKPVVAEGPRGPGAEGEPGSAGIEEPGTDGAQGPAGGDAGPRSR